MLLSHHERSNKKQKLIPMVILGSLGQVAPQRVEHTALIFVSAQLVAPQAILRGGHHIRPIQQANARHE